jgi:hypothetical protein
VHTEDSVTEHYVLNNHLRFKILYHPAAEEMEENADTSDGTFMKVP